MNVVLKRLKEFFAFTNDYIAPFWLWLGIIYSFVQVAGYAPYNIKFERQREIVPFIQLFPGQKIRLGVDPANETMRQDISDVVWKMYKSDTQIDLPNLKGFFPTIKLPPEGGIYSLKASAKIQGKRQESNFLNFYITQDNLEAVAIKFNKLTSISVEKSLVSDGQKILEVLNVGNHWAAVDVGKNKDAEFPEGAQAKAIDGKIFIRSKSKADESYELYDVIEINTIPKDSFAQQHLDSDGLDKK